MTQARDIEEIVAELDCYKDKTSYPDNYEPTVKAWELRALIADWRRLKKENDQLWLVVDAEGNGLKDEKSGI